MRKLCILFIILTSLSTLLSAQEVKDLNIEQLIAKALESNHQILIAAQQVNQAEGAFRQTDAGFLPQISLTHTAINTNTPLMAFGSKLNQGKVTAADFAPESLNKPDGVSNFNTAIEFAQPMFNRTAQLNRRSAKMAIDLKEIQLSETRAFLTFQLEEVFMQLQLTYHKVKTTEKTLEWIIAIEQQARDFYEEGIIHLADLLEISYRKNQVENQIKAIQKEVKNISDLISYLKGEEPGNIWNPVGELSTHNQIPPSSSKPLIMREDIQLMKKVTEINQIQRDVASASILPELNAFGNFQLNDSKAFHGRSNGYLIGLQLKWNVFDGGMRRGRIQESTAKHRQSLIELEEYQIRSESELNRVVREYELAIANEESAEKGLEFATEVLRLRTDRFEQGMEKITDLLQAESRLTEKQLKYQKAIYQKNIAASKLQYLTRGIE
ncbi:MAG: TolC family protein [Saprospirales bacterium]|nr:MAG: TolC family protein [Saprospirales bacterium]